MKKLLALLILGTLVVSGCSKKEAQQKSDDLQAQAEQAASDAQDSAQKAADDATTVDVFDTLVKSGNHSTLVAAIEAAGLRDQLQSGGPVTVFAPTDDAFKKLNPEQVSKLLLPESKDALTKILTLHVVNGKITSADLKTQDVVTLNGESVPVVVDETNKSVTFGAANVVKPDINASNGVIHDIDTVILPAPKG